MEAYIRQQQRPGRPRGNALHSYSGYISSNLDWDATILIKDFRGFPLPTPQPILGISGIIPRLGHNRFLPNPPQFMIHQSSSPGADRARKQPAESSDKAKWIWRKYYIQLHVGIRNRYLFVMKKEETLALLQYNIRCRGLIQWTGPVQKSDICGAWRPCVFPQPEWQLLNTAFNCLQVTSSCVLNRRFQNSTLRHPPRPRQLCKYFTLYLPSKLVRVKNSLSIA